VRRLLRILLIAVAALAALYGLLYLRSRHIGHAVALKYSSEPLPGELVVRPAFAVPALKGTFGSNARAAVEELGPILLAHPYPTDQVARQSCYDVRDGKLPVEKLPPECLAALDAGREPMHRIMAAAHSESGGGPPAMEMWTTTEGAPAYWSHILSAAKLGALEARLMLSRGEVAPALLRCQEIVALGRESSLGGYILGRMLGIGMQQEVGQVCLDALRAASPGDRRAARDALALLEKSMPGFDYTMHTEATWAALEGCGSRLSADERSSMPLANRALAEENVLRSDGNLGPRPFLGRILFGDICRRAAKMDEELGALGPMPADRGHAAAEAVVDRFSWPEWVIRTPAAFPPNWAHYVDRDHEARAELAEIVKAAGK
jgi:hypothetical protein